jgi:hypothetical protein
LSNHVQHYKITVPLIWNPEKGLLVTALPKPVWNPGIELLDEVGRFAFPNVPMGEGLGLATFVFPKPANPPNPGIAVGVEVAGKPAEGVLVLLVLLNPVMLGLPKPVWKLLGWTGGFAAVKGADVFPKENPAKGLVVAGFPWLPTELWDAVLFVRRFGTAMGRSGCGLLQ